MTYCYRSTSFFVLFPRAATAAAVLHWANEGLTAPAVDELYHYSAFELCIEGFFPTAGAVNPSLAQCKTAGAVAALGLL